MGGKHALPSVLTECGNELGVLAKGRDCAHQRIDIAGCHQEPGNAIFYKLGYGASFIANGRPARRKTLGNGPAK